MAAAKQHKPETRRSFLTRSFQWAGAVIGAALAWPLFRFLDFTIKPKPRYVKVAAPLPASGYHLERDFILFAGKGAPRAVSRTCTHLGCRVNFLEDKRIIECPCHQSRFTPEGKLIRGPAKKNLPVFPVKLQTNESGAVTAYVVTL